MSKPDIYLLRDHVTLFTDVAKDWISGPAGDFNHFVPYLYDFNLDISDYTLRLYVNDHNVINNPSSLADNSVFPLPSPSLCASSLTVRSLI